MISINNVINIQASLPGRGLSNYNTANILILTNETPINPGEYGIHLGSSTVKEDYGTASIVYKMAQSVFAQSPNIKNNNGYLVVAPMILASALVEFSAEPDEGSYDIDVQGEVITVNFDDTASDIQESLRDFPALNDVIVEKVGMDFVYKFPSLRGSSPVITISNSTLKAGGVDVVTVVKDEVVGETLLEAIERIKSKVDFTGVLESFSISNAEKLAVAPWFQDFENRAIHFITSGDTSSVEPETGIFSKILDGLFTRSRCLFKTGSDEERNLFKASYASRMMSTNFAAFDSVLTAHLKDLATVQVDNNINQTLLEKIKAAGADCYPSIQGIPKVFTSGKNWFFDRVHNLLWFVGACQVAYFNVLAKTSTKIPQTEGGVAVLTGAITRVCEQGVNNGYIAPGEWTDEVPFGNPDDFMRNIREKGYYIFTAPIALQSPADREDRKAPIMQIAIKESGAIHSGNVIVNINP